MVDRIPGRTKNPATSLGNLLVTQSGEFRARYLLLLRLMAQCKSR